MLCCLPLFSWGESLGDLLKKGEGKVTELLGDYLGEEGGDRLFYYPTKKSPHLPKIYGLKEEDVYFKTKDGFKLHGWFFNPKGVAKPKGTIVYSHGNSGAVGYHLFFVAWMIEAGYQVLLYDYRGFGKSEGEPTREGLIEDVRAAFAYVKTRKDVDAKRLISWGHSLGGAKSFAALGGERVKGLRAAVSYAGFASYQDMARRVAGEVGAGLVNDRLSARDYVGGLSPAHVLVIHGDEDVVVPVEQAEILFRNAKEPKTFFRIEGGGHTTALYRNEGEYRQKVLGWLEKALR